jgi:hypothetical protein
MATAVHLRTTGLARQIAAAERAGLQVLPGTAGGRGGLAAALDAAADAIERRCRAGEPLDQVVARESLNLPPALAAVLTTAASGGDGHAALLALQDAAERGAAESWRWWLDVAYPLLVCALAAAGLVVLAGWYGPLIAAVDDTLSSPRAGAIFDARPVVEAVRIPVIATLVGLAGAAIAWLRLTDRRRAAEGSPQSRLGEAVRAMLAANGVSQGADGVSRGAEEAANGIVEPIVAAISGGSLPAGALVTHAAAIAEPMARQAALATVADHERMVAAARCRSQGRVPAMIGSIVAGLAVLLYGVALFKPLVTVMQRVAEQPPVEQWRSGP